MPNDAGHSIKLAMDPLLALAGGPLHRMMSPILYRPSFRPTFRQQSTGARATTLNVIKLTALC